MGVSDIDVIVQVFEYFTGVSLVSQVMIGSPVQDLAAAVAAISAQELPAPGMESDLVVLAEVYATLQTQLARRMAVVELNTVGVSDVVGQVSAAGVAPTHARLLRRTALFAQHYPELEHRWLAGSVTTEQVEALHVGSRGLSAVQRESLVREAAPLLPTLTLKESKAVIRVAVDAINPGDPDNAEQNDYHHRSLNWAEFRSGISFQGYLPTVEAGAFRAVINALAEASRVDGDGVTATQRRADALAALVAKASEHGLPSGGGLPAAVTLTVSLTEADRIAQRDPAQHPLLPEQRRPHNGNRIGDTAVGDASVRFAMCCGAITPVLVDLADPDSLLAKIGKTRVDPLAVGRAVRLATTSQRKALQLRDGGCVVAGCTVEAAYTQPHHVMGYAIGGKTDYENLASLCWSHHRQVELGRIVLSRSTAGQYPYWQASRRL